MSAFDLGARKEVVTVEVSARHLHLTKLDATELFGRPRLHKVRDLSQPGEFAARETVTIENGKKSIKEVRVVGPFRNSTEVELATTDARALGYLNLPLKTEYAAHGGALIIIRGPKGAIKRRAAYIPARHLHCDPATAERLGLKDGERVQVSAGTERRVVFDGVLVRIRSTYHWGVHLDTDEGNAAGITGSTQGTVWL